MVIDACNIIDESEMKEKIYCLSKLEILKEEDFEMKSYLKEMNMLQARMNFRIRTCMTKCKMNYSSNPRNKEALWQCQSCESNIDTQQHIMWCPAYKDLREGKSMDSETDVVNYFIEVMKIRTKMDLTR